MVKFTIGGKEVPLDKNEMTGTMVDISSVYNYFPSSVYKFVLAEIYSIFKDLKFSKPDPFSCFLYSGRYVSSVRSLINGCIRFNYYLLFGACFRIEHDFPSITYTFDGGADMTIHPKQYIFERSVRK